MIFKWENFVDCIQSGLKYLPNTLYLTIVSVIVGLVVGTIVAIIRYYKVKVISQILAVLVTIYNGIPFVLSMMLINTFFTFNFNSIAEFFGWNITINDVDRLWIGFLVLSLLNIGHMSEAMRGAFESISKFQYEAGYSVGMTIPQTLCRIIIPQVIPIAIPILISNITMILKTSAIAYQLGIFEVYNGSILPCNLTYSFLEGYVAAAVIYWALAIIIENIGRLIEKNAGKFIKTPARNA